MKSSSGRSERLLRCLRQLRLADQGTHPFRCQRQLVDLDAERPERVLDRVGDVVGGAHGEAAVDFEVEVHPQAVIDLLAGIDRSTSSP